MKYLVFIFAVAFLSCSDNREPDNFEQQLIITPDIVEDIETPNPLLRSVLNAQYGIGLVGEESIINFNTTYGDFKDYFNFNDTDLDQNIDYDSPYKDIPRPIQRRSQWPKPIEVNNNPIITYHPDDGINLYWTVGDKDHNHNRNKNILSIIVLYPPFQGLVNFHINNAINYINLSQYTYNEVPYIKLNESIKIEEDQSFEMFSMHAYGMFEKNYSIENTNFWLGVHPNRSPIHCLKEDPFMIAYSETVRKVQYKGEKCKVFTREELTIIYLPNLILYFENKKLFKVDLLRPINENTEDNIEENQTEIYRVSYENYEDP